MKKHLVYLSVILMGLSTYSFAQKANNEKCYALYDLTFGITSNYNHSSGLFRGNEGVAYGESITFGDKMVVPWTPLDSIPDRYIYIGIYGHFGTNSFYDFERWSRNLGFGLDLGTIVPINGSKWSAVYGLQLGMQQTASKYVYSGTDYRQGRWALQYGLSVFLQRDMFWAAYWGIGFNIGGTYYHGKELSLPTGMVAEQVRGLIPTSSIMIRVGRRFEVKSGK